MDNYKVIINFFGQPNAFSASSYQNPPLPIDNAYVDEHLSCMVAALVNTFGHYANGAYLPNKYGCPCSAGNELAPPPYVGNDYYCETGDILLNILLLQFIDTIRWAAMS